MALYMLWPYGQYIVVTRRDSFWKSSSERPPPPSHSAKEKDPLVPALQATPVPPKTACGRIRYALWLAIAMPPAALAHILALCVSTMLVVFIPMAKVSGAMLRNMLVDPEDMIVTSSLSRRDLPESSEVIVGAIVAANLRYWRYNVLGVPILIVTMSPLVLCTLVFGYLVPKASPLANPVFLFFIGLGATVPLSFLIGWSITALSAQTTFAVGAFVNAIFGSGIEVVLYSLAIYRGLNDLTQAGITGAILGSAVLIPALSMIVGGIKHRQLRFNPIATSTSGALLLISVIGVLAPTLFYQSYANYDLNCDQCTLRWDRNGTVERNLTCTGCDYREDLDLASDPIYTKHAQPLSWFCAAVMPLAYIVGLVFTLKTHSYMYERQYFETHFRGTEDKSGAPEQEGGGGDEHQHDSAAEGKGDHGGPGWGKLVSTLVLLGCVIVYTGVADVITESIEPMLQSVHMSQEFIGLTFIAITPNLAEYLNAMLFAWRGDLDLSLEISGQGAVQVALLQVPLLVLVSSILAKSGHTGGFTLIFPMMHLVVIVFAIIVRNEIVWDSRANYFMGAALLACWLLLIAAFFFVPSMGSDDPATSESSSIAASGALSTILRGNRRFF
jgi:Ca2+:H+ antiporter